MQWAVSTDALVEGRHFLSTVPPDALGHKALAVNLSDLAACGAKPVAFTLSLTLPRVDETFLAGFAQGLYALADAHGIPGLAVRTRAEVAGAVAQARSAPGTFLLNFMVEKEESVYPMIPAGAALHEMIRRPGKDPLLETADDQ